MTRMRAVTTIPEPWACRCRPKSYVIATFRNQNLVTVTRMHNRLNRDGSPQNCHLAPETLDPADWGARR